MKPKPTPNPEPSPSYIDKKLLERSLNIDRYSRNVLVNYLRSVVGNDAVSEAVGRYFIGTSQDGGTVFWQIDLHGNIRTGKIILYDTTGHRRKDVTPPLKWVHKAFKLSDFNLSQCLFGEHLLIDKLKTVAVVESEKSAVIASCYFPDIIWVACGGCNNLSLKRCEPLKGRKVTLYPDAGKFDEWSKKAKELSTICNVSVSSLIEECATDEERQAGFDIADYLVRFSPSDFIRQSTPQQPAAVMAENSAVKTDIVNPVVAAMCAKNPALSRLIETFDCEITRTDTYEPQPSRLLNDAELKRLAAGLPDFNSWTENELCQLLKIEPQHVRSLKESKQIDFISQTGRYCRANCTPF